MSNDPMTMQRATPVTKRTMPTVASWSPKTTSVASVLHRQCACGTHTMGGGKCAGCAKKKSGLQRKLTIGASNDPLEREADRIAEQVMAAPAHSYLNAISPRIQRFAGHAARKTDLAPASVDRVLASPRRPLEPALQQEMGQRFGYDFSRVRVHTDAAAEQSARDVNAHAYTVGYNVVFGAGRFAPGTHEGRRLIAHELTHVVQQRGPKPVSLQKQEEMEAGRDTFEEEAERVGTLMAESEMTEEEEHESVSAELAEKPSTSKSKSSKKKTPITPKSPPNPCTRTILAEGTCADLVAGSRFICCDPDKGIERKGRKTDIDGNLCPSKKFTPIFTCDSKCDKALEKGCDDNDNWMAVPNNQFTRKQCGDIWTICANGKNTKGYVRDHSITETRFEVSPKIQKDLGVTVGSSFKGAVYKPGATQAAIDKDACCNS